MNVKYQEIHIEYSANIISIFAILIASLSALYARWSVKEASKSNSIGRMNALLSFRNHYLELMRYQEKMGEVLKNSKSGTQAVLDKYSELDTKFREVNKELEKYHDKVIKNEI